MGEKPIVQQFNDDLQAVVDKYRDQGITFAEALGAIEIVKLDLWSESQDESEEWE